MQWYDLLQVLINFSALSWAFQLIFVTWNLSQWRGLKPASRMSFEISVNTKISVLIPARNEESRIRACIDSLKAQTDNHFEVIVLDDGSTDGTAMVLEDLSREYPLLKVESGTSLPEDWFGKPYACWQLAGHATGEWLLFLDADTRLHPDAIRRLRIEAMESGYHLVSGFGRLSGPSKASLLLTSLMAFVVAMHLPVRLVSHTQDPRFVAANGALLFIQKSMYDRIGGHKSQRQDLVEDMGIARTVKTAGGKVALRNLSEILATEMYDSFGDAWRGYQKNSFPGIGKSYAILVGIELYYTTLFMLPWVVLGISLFAALQGGHLPTLLWVGMSSWSVLCGAVAKRLVDSRFAIPCRISLAFPLSVFLMMAVLFQSAFRCTFRLGYVWKGRVYS